MHPASGKAGCRFDKNLFYLDSEFVNSKATMKTVMYYRIHNPIKWILLQLPVFIYLYTLTIPIYNQLVSSVNIQTYIKLERVTEGH